MIEIKNLSFNYPGSKHKVFDGLNLTLNQKRIYGLLGKNGTGKSTLLYLISGLLRPKKGSLISMVWKPRNATPRCCANCM